MGDLNKIIEDLTSKVLEPFDEIKNIGKRITAKADKYLPNGKIMSIVIPGFPRWFIGKLVDNIVYFSLDTNNKPYQDFIEFLQDSKIPIKGDKEDWVNSEGQTETVHYIEIPIAYFDISEGATDGYYRILQRMIEKSGDISDIMKNMAKSDIIAFEKYLQDQIAGVSEDGTPLPGGSRDEEVKKLVGKWIYRFITKRDTLKEIKQASHITPEEVLQVYRSILRGIEGPNGRDYVEFRKWWENWVAEMRRDHKIPGILTLDFLKRVPKQDLIKIFFEFKKWTKKIPLDEQVQPKVDKKQLYKEFFKFAVNDLGLQKPYPKIKLTADKSDTKTYGHFDPNDNTIVVYTKGRGLGDVLRTIAHELVHRKQDQDNKLTPDSGETGSPIENEANAYAGVMLRNFGEKHPQIFTEGLQKEVRQVGKRIKALEDGNDIIIKTDDNTTIYGSPELDSNLIKFYYSPLDADAHNLGVHLNSGTENVVEFFKKHNIPFKEFKNFGNGWGIFKVERVYFDFTRDPLVDDDIDEVKNIAKQNPINNGEFRKLLASIKEQFGDRIKDLRNPETYPGYEYGNPIYFSYGSLYSDAMFFSFFIENITEEDKKEIQHIVDFWVAAHQNTITYKDNKLWSDIHIYPEIQYGSTGDNDKVPYFESNIRCSIMRQFISSTGGSMEETIKALTEAILEPFDEIKNLAGKSYPIINPDKIYDFKGLSDFAFAFNRLPTADEKKEITNINRKKKEKVAENNINIINDQVLPKIKKELYDALHSEALEKIKTLGLRPYNYYVSNQEYLNVELSYFADFFKLIDVKDGVYYKIITLPEEAIVSFFGDINIKVCEDITIIEFNYNNHSLAAIIGSSKGCDKPVGIYSEKGYVSAKGLRDLLLIKDGLKFILNDLLEIGDDINEIKNVGPAEKINIEVDRSYGGVGDREIYKLVDTKYAFDNHFFENNEITVYKTTDKDEIDGFYIMSNFESPFHQKFINWLKDRNIFHYKVVDIEEESDCEIIIPKEYFNIVNNE